MTHEQDATAFWEDRYAGASPVWSGRANAALVTEVSGLAPGRALDLGCGEGGDALWLAAQGWRVTGVDLSTTALARAGRAARDAGLPEGAARWVALDLAAWAADDPVEDDALDGPFDLVAASFLHSPVTFPRTAVLRRAAGLLAPGGHLVVVAHAAFPPWSNAHDRHDHTFLTPEQEVAALDLPAGEWEVVTAQVRPREATGPDGSRAVLDDAVVRLRRR